ncbi:MAG TPA: GNAT family protein [Thermoanaerobaculia bacterium]|nr:GNAT family protein [Thermoanaerobaculia bacterium]
MSEPPLPTRQGTRVRLAFPQEDDGPELIALYRVSRDFYRGLASPPATQEAFARYLERCRQPSYVGLLLRRRSDAAILGSISLSEIVRGIFQGAYLGYQIGAPFARQGYMTEGLGLVLHYAFVRLKLHRLEANIQPGNQPSLALVKRLGFRREGLSPRYLKIAGRWRDHERWAILAEDWRKKK